MAIAPVVSTKKAPGANGGTTDAVDTTGANLIVLSVSSYTLGTSPTISDSKSNSWIALTPQETASTGGRIRLYYCTNPTVGSGHTFTAIGTTSFAAIEEIAYSGAATSPYDQESGANTGALLSSLQPGSITPFENNCVLVTAVNFVFGSSITIDSGFAASTIDFSSGNNFAMGIADLVQTTAGAVNPAWSDGSQTIATVMASFKAASGANNYTQSLSGTLTLTTSTISKSCTKPLTGTITTSAIFTKICQQSKSGVLTLTSSTILKACTKGLTGTITLTSSTITKLCSKTLTGIITLTPSAVVKTLSKSLIGIITLTPTLAKAMTKAVVGSLSFSGVLGGVKVIVQSLTGTLTLTSSTITKISSKTLVGSITLTTSTVVKSCSKSVISTLTLGGSLAKKCLKSLIGSFSLSGILNKVFNPTVPAVSVPPTTYDNLDFQYTVNDEIDFQYTTRDNIDFE